MICGGAALYPRYLHRTDQRETWEKEEFPRNDSWPKCRRDRSGCSCASCLERLSARGIEDRFNKAILIPHIFVWVLVFDSVSRVPPPPPAASLTLTIQNLTYNTFTYNYFTHTNLTHTNLIYNNFTHTHTHTPLSHTISHITHTHLCHIPSLTSQLCHTPSLTYHNFTHTLILNSHLP